MWCNQLNCYEFAIAKGKCLAHMLMVCDQPACRNMASDKGKCIYHLKMICKIPGCCSMRNVRFPLCGFHMEMSVFSCYFPSKRRRGNLCTHHLLKVQKKNKCTVLAKFSPPGSTCCICNL